MSETEEFEIAPGQRFAGNVTAGALTVFCGLFLLLCGTGVFDIAVTDILLAAVLFTIGFMLLLTGIIQKNTVSLWLSVLFILPAVVEILAKFTHLTYGNLFPLYIAAPAVASLVTMFISRSVRAHIYVIMFFGILGAIFALKSSAVLGWEIVLPILVVYVGCLIIFYALKLNKPIGGENT